MDIKKDSLTLSRTDFLTLLMQDDLFKYNDSYMIDECITFMFASTQTTTVMTSTALMYLANQKSSCEKIRKELIKETGISDFQSVDKWDEILTYDNLNNLTFLS